MFVGDERMSNKPCTSKTQEKRRQKSWNGEKVFLVGKVWTFSCAVESCFENVMLREGKHSNIVWKRKRLGIDSCWYLVERSRDKVRICRGWSTRRYTILGIRVSADGKIFPIKSGYAVICGCKRDNTVPVVTGVLTIRCRRCLDDPPIWTHFSFLFSFFTFYLCRFVILCIRNQTFSVSTFFSKYLWSI